MNALRDCEIGDIIEITVFRWHPSEDNRADPPIYGLVTSFDGNGGPEATWVCGGDEEFAQDRERSKKLVIAEWDKWTVVPMDQWPDEVCIALAKRALAAEPEEA